jgi:hypothetical protein
MSPGIELPGWGRYDAGSYWGTPYSDQDSKEQELDFLRNQSTILEDELESIKSRLQELENTE